MRTITISVTNAAGTLVGEFVIPVDEKKYQRAMNMLWDVETPPIRRMKAFIDFITEKEK